MKIERALIVQKEHLDNIFAGIKVWEMRSTRTTIRERIGLIEAGSGLIMGEVDIIDSYDPIIKNPEEYYFFHRVKNVELLEKWRCPWVLFNAKRYDKPIPYRHPKGAVIWVKLDK